MFTRRTRLKHAALNYAANGWPVAPAIDLVVSRWSNVLIGCGCSFGTSCPQPGGHPIDNDWRSGATTDANLIRSWWSRATSTPNVLLAPGETFDVWCAPSKLGAASAELLRLESLFAPVARTAEGQWLFFTQPAGNVANLQQIGVGRLTYGDYLAAPPSWYGAHRRDRWLTPPAVGTLPPWEPVAMVLLEAARRTQAS